MTTKQRDAAKRALNWCLGIFSADEIEDIKKMLDDPHLNYLQANALVGSLMDCSRLRADAEEEKKLRDNAENYIRDLLHDMGYPHCELCHGPRGKEPSRCEQCTEDAK